MNNKAKNDKKIQDEQIQQLQKQIDDLNEQNTAKIKKTKSYITKYDKLKFSYPDDWKLIDSSAESTTQIRNEYGIPGQDVIKITSPDGFEISISSGGLGGSACPPGTANVSNSEKITTLGLEYYLNYRKNNTSEDIEDIYLATKPDQCTSDLSSRNIVIKENGNGAGLSISAKYANGKTPTYDQLKSDPNIQAYKNFLQSLSY
jgi:hypothetical protein